MRITESADIAKIVKKRRKALKLTQAECAAFCGVGNRFFSELENGKVSLHIGKVLNILQMLGINLHAIEKEKDTEKGHDKWFWTFTFQTFLQAP